MTKIEWRTVSIDYPQLRGAQNIEEVMCYATLIASGRRDINNVMDAKSYWEDLDKNGFGCSDCPYIQSCSACIINE